MSDERAAACHQATAGCYSSLPAPLSRNQFHGQPPAVAKMSTRGSDASRPPSRSKSAALSSSAAGSRIRSQDDALPSNSQKRKRDSPAFPLEELLKPAITIKVCTAHPVATTVHDPDQC